MASVRGLELLEGKIFGHREHQQPDASIYQGDPNPVDYKKYELGDPDENSKARRI
ncbi:hypothetical protein ACVME8_002991 [Bradyrhizobium diazoefficiens]